MAHWDRNRTAPRIAHALATVFIFAAALQLAQRSDTTTPNSSDIPNAQTKQGSEPKASDPANRPPGAAATTGSESGTGKAPSGGSSAPAPGGGAPPANASPSNTAPR